MKGLVIVSLIFLSFCCFAENNATQTLTINISKEPGSGGLEIDENESYDCTSFHITPGEKNTRPYDTAIKFSYLESIPRKITINTDLAKSNFPLEVKVYSITDKTCIYSNEYKILSLLPQNIINHITACNGEFYIKYRALKNNNKRGTDTHFITITILSDV